MIRVGEENRPVFYSVGENGVDEQGAEGSDDIMLFMFGDFELDYEVDAERGSAKVVLKNVSGRSVYVWLERECFAGVIYDEAGRDYRDARAKPEDYADLDPVKLAPGEQMAWLLSNRSMAYEKQRYFDPATMKADSVELELRAGKDRDSIKPSFTLSVEVQ